MLTILITGATGFLGSHLVQTLVKLNYQVIILKRQNSKLNRLKNVLNNIISYDVDTVELSRPFQEHQKIDAIIHTATCYGRSNEPFSEILATNVIFPLQLVEIATFFNTKLFFNTDTVLSKYLNGYALAKNQFLEWGKLATKIQKIRFINIKLEHMYGHSDNDSKFTTHVIKSCFTNVPELKLTFGEQTRDFIYIDDVVSAYITLLQQSAEQSEWFQEYELGSGQSTSIKEFVETVHKITNSHTQLNFGALPYRDNEIMYSQADTTALRQLGWSNRTTLTEGIEKTIQQDYFS